MISSRAVAPAFLLLLACTSAFPDNIQQAKELPETSDSLSLEAEASESIPRAERCATCAGGNLNAGPDAFPSNIAASFQALPGAEVHSQSSFQGCSTEKGCAGIKVKDGTVVEKYGDVDAFKAAANADTANEFNFHAGLAGNEVFAGGIPKDGPFWWMKENSPFRDAYGNYEKFSKSSSSQVSSGGAGSGSGAGGAGFSATLDLSGNPFLNGDISKLGSGFIGGAQGSSASGSFGSSQGGVDLSNNPFLNGKVQPSGGSSTFQSSSFESSYSSNGKESGAIDLSKNPFLNGAGFSGTSKFGAGQSGAGSQAGQGGQFSGGKFASSSSSFGSQSSGQFGGAGNTGGVGSTGANNGQFGIQAGFQSGQPGSSTVNKFTGSSTGYTGSSPSPFTASTGSSFNQIDNSQKTSELDFEQQQQTQGSIDELFSHFPKPEEHNTGELQQTCAGQGYICVHKAQCNNGVVNTNGAGILQARTKKQYCNTKSEICCRIEVSNVPGSGIDLQGNLGVGSATFGASGSGSSIFGSNTNSAGSRTFGSTSGSSSPNQFGVGNSASGIGQTGTTSFGATGSSTNQFGQAGSTGQNFGGSGSNGANSFGVTNTFESSSTKYGSSSSSGQGGANGASGSNFGASASGANSGSTFGASASGNTGSTGTNGFGASGTFGFKGTTSSSFDNRFKGSNGGGLIHISPSNGESGVVFKDSTDTQNNFVETSDSFSAGSQTDGVFRPGSQSGLKPGIPYLPPTGDTSSGGSSNTVSSTYRPNPSTPRPYNPTTTGPTYLPPQGEQSINRPTFVPGPKSPEDTEGSLILDQNREPRPRPRQPTQPFQPTISEIPAGCAAALKCTPIEFCTAEGVISNTSVRLTKDQEDFRVPLTDCKDVESGTIGKCCRDSTYTDPWPTNQLGKWVPGVFGGDDGAYKPDSRGTPTNPRPVRVRPTPPPTSGGLILNNYRTTESPDFPYPGPNQVTPGFGGVTQPGQGPRPGQGVKGQFGKGQQVSQGFGQTTSQGFGQSVSQGFGQTVTQGQGQFGQAGQAGKGQFGQAGQGQFGQAGQGQFGQAGKGQFGQAGQGQFGQVGKGQFGQVGQGQFGQVGQGQIVSTGQGQFGQVGQGQTVSRGQGQFGQAGQGQFGQAGKGQFGQVGQQGFGQTVTQATSQTVTQQRGQFGQQDQGQSETQGQGQFGQVGQGQIVSQGQGQIVSQGQGQFVSQGQGEIVNQGQGQIVSQGQGQIISQGQGQFGQRGQGQTVSQGQGQFGQVGQGQAVSQGQGQIVSQGVGQFVQKGQGQVVSQGQGQFGQVGQGQAVSQGQGQFGQVGQGQAVSQGQGQFGQVGQGQIVSTGQGQFGQFGQGQIVSQGQGQFGQGGQGQFVSKGQGQFGQVGQGQIVSQGQGQIVSQGGGAFGQYETGESVQRVFLSRYGAGGQCGLQKGQKPYGNRNELEVDFSEIPWQAMVLLQTNRSLLCGGVITRPEVVVTSAACVDGLEAKSVLIKGGEWKLGIDEEPLPFQIVQVKTILRHPGYRRGSLHNDVAILVLQENLRLANNIQPICLPGAGDTLDGFYNGAGECIVSGWGKQVLQVNVAGAIMHSLNVSLINPGECQAKISQDYPHLLEQYDADSCACGQPTNPLNNICRVDIGSALACTTGDGRFVMRGVYSWDSGCQAGNQLAAFYKFDLEWYEWALGLSEGSGRFTQQFGGQAQVTQRFTQQSRFSQVQQGGDGGALGTGFGIKGGAFGGGFGIKGSALTGGFNAGIKGGQFNSAIKGGQGFSSSFSSSSFSEKDSLGGGAGLAAFGKPTLGAEKYQFEGKAPVKGSSFSASYSSQEKQYYQSKPQIVTYTTKPEIVTYTTKPEVYTYTTKPEIFTYTTKPKIVTFTTKPQIITYETSGSGQNPQYIAPGVTFNPSFSEVVGAHARAHGSECKCLENGKK